MNNILNQKQNDKYLDRVLEIKKIALEEKEEYEKRRAEFYNNPFHWDNNKRRRHHLPVLRGSINKNRSKHYHASPLTTRSFCLIENIINEVLEDKIKNNELFEHFVDVKTLMKD